MKLLYVEDEISHVVLTERTLAENLHQEFHLIHAETIAEAFRILAQEPDIDLVLSDLRLPDGTGLELLKKIREQKDPPAVVLVTAQGDQEIAVAALKAGAADYLVKQSDYLHRLSVVISNAVAQNRYLREQAALRAAEIKYQSLVEQIPAVVFLDAADENGTNIYVSPRIQELTGYTAEEWHADPTLWSSSIHPEDRKRIIARGRRSNRERSRFFEEYRIIRRDGKILWVKEDTNLVFDSKGHPLYWQGILIDITKEKEDEAALHRHATELEALYQASRLLTLRLEPEVIADHLIKTIDQLIDYEFASVYLVEGQSQLLAPLVISQKLETQENYDKETLLSKTLPLVDGMIRWVIEHGQPIRNGQVSRDDRDLSVSKPVKFELCLPLTARGKTIGALDIRSSQAGAFTEQNESLLTALANSAAIAFENARLYKSELARREQAEILRTATASLSTAVDLRNLYEIIFESIAQLVPYDYAFIELMKQDCLEVVAEHGLQTEPSLIGTTHSWSSGEWLDLEINPHKPIMFANGVSEKRLSSWMRVPMVAGDQVLGLINLENRQPNFYTGEHATVIQTFAGQAGIALEKAQLYNAALQAAERRAVLHRISQEIVRFSQNPEQIYTAIHEAAGKLMACDVFMIVLRDETRNENVPVYVIDAGSRLELNSVDCTVGLCGHVIGHGTSLILRDKVEIAQREGFHFGSSIPIQSLVAVPLRTGDRVMGMISAQSYKPYSYDLEEQVLLEMLGTHAATAIENSRLFELETKRRQEAENLRQAASIISSTLDPNHVVKEILIALKQVIAYDNATVFFYEGDQLRVAMAPGRPHANTLTNLTVPADDPLFQLMQQTGHPVILQDAQTDRRFMNWGSTATVLGWMAIPLVARGKVIGCITLDSYSAGAYNERVVETAMAFANQAAAGIENARLFQEQSRRSRIIETLADIANEIATTREVLPALDEIARRALDLLHASHMAIYLLQEDHFTLKIVIAHGTYRKELLGHTRKVGEGITGNIFLKGKPEILNNTRADPRRVVVPGTSQESDKLESLMSAPLVLRGKPIGVINAWRAKQDGVFSEMELSFLVGIAHQVSICIESGRLFQETNRQAQEAAAIAEVGRNISSTLQLDSVLERIASYAIDLLHAETSAVYLAEANTSRLRAVTALGADAEEIKNDPLVIGEGILGNIALQNVGEIVNDTVKDARTRIVKGTEQNPFEHIMGVPVMLKDKHTGLLAVWRTGIGAEFAPRELEFLTSLARQAAVAIENARLYNEAQRRLKELEIINRVSTSLRMAQSPDEMIPILLNEILHLVSTPHGSVWLFDHATDKLVQRNARGAETNIKHTTLNLTDGIVGHTFTTERTYIAPDLKNDGFVFEGNQDSVIPGLGGIYIPIQSTAGPVGVLAILTETGRQVTEEINLLTILAEITGNSIHRAQLYEKSQKQVRRLTSLRDIDSAIASSFDLRLTLNILMDQTLSHLNVDAVNIGLYYPDLQAISYLPGLGFNIPSPTRPLVRIGEGLAGQVILKQQACHISDIENTPEARNESLIKREGFVSYIAIPLIVKGQIKGVFEVFHRIPFSPAPDWMEFLQTLAGQAAIAIDSTQLFENLQRSNQELKQAYDTTLEGWARALELRDRETEGHTRRVTDLTIDLARYMGISDSEMENIHRGVLLHDIGKMGVPDNILKKTGELTSEEWEEMRQHPVYAYNLLAPISFLRGALDIPYCHHEHWDGGGYPRGLKGEQIPLAARIFSVVDNWDALLTDRPYRKAWPEDKVIVYLKETAGKVLDPRIVEIFLRMMEKGEKQTG